MNLLDEIPSTTIALISAIIVIPAVIFLPRLCWSLWTWWRVPGPWGLPLVGYYPFLRKDFYVQLSNFAKSYGDVYGINILGQRYIHLNSSDAARDALVKQAENFPGRSHKHGILQYVLEEGVIFSEGEQWRALRRSLIQGMKEVGMGFSKKDPLRVAVEDTVEELHKTKGSTVDFTELLSQPCTSVIRRVVLGDNISKEEEDKLSSLYIKTLIPMFGSNLLLIGPIAKYFFLPRIKGYKEMLQAKLDLDDLLYKILNDHKRIFDPEHPKDLMDIFLKERMRRKDKGDPLAALFTDSAIIGTMLLAFGDGSASVCAFIASFLKQFARRRNLQDIVYQEILKEIGTEQIPTWEDRIKLVQTYAIIREMQRTLEFMSVLPTMECRKETTVSGVPVPKGSVLLLNAWSIHHNPENFKNPDEFDHTRFLTEDQTQLKSDQLYGFGFGKRACAGEPMVMLELFVFIAAILQQFVLEPEEDANDDPTVIITFNFKLKALPRTPKI